MIRHGVIGCGQMGRNHIRAVARLADVCLAGVYDTTPAKGAEAAAEVGTTSYGTLADLLANVDAVSICTPTENHAQSALAAVAAGKHVFVEKPLAGTLEEAKEIAVAARAAGVVAAVGHIERFNPAYEALLDAMTQRPDKPVTVSCRRVGPLPGRPRATGAVMELGVHDVDLLLDLFGEPVQASALLQPGSLGYDVHSVVALRFPVTTATVESSRLYRDQARTMTLHFPDETWHVDFKEPSFIGTGGVARSLERRNQVEAELVDFHAAIAGRGLPRVSIADGLRVLRVIQDAGAA